MGGKKVSRKSRCRFSMMLVDGHEVHYLLVILSLQFQRNTLPKIKKTTCHVWGCKIRVHMIYSWTILSSTATHHYAASFTQDWVRPGDPNFPLIAKSPQLLLQLQYCCAFLQRDNYTFLIIKTHYQSVCLTWFAVLYGSSDLGDHYLFKGLDAFSQLECVTMWLNNTTVSHAHSYFNIPT